MRIEWYGMEWNGMEWNGMEWNAIWNRDHHLMEIDQWNRLNDELNE
ncbi:hypothetical protein ACXZ9C_01020 [Streptococcus agalactiae]